MNIEFFIKKKKYEINHIRIKDYYVLQSALMMKHDELAFDIVSMLSGCPTEDLKKLNPQTWIEIWASLQVKLEKELLQDLEARSTIKLDGVEYGLVDFESMSIGEFADLDVLIQDPKMENRLHEIMAILYRPVISSNFFKYKIEEYDVETYKERCEKFLDLPIKTAKAVMSFFLSSGITSLNLTNLYLSLTEKEKHQANYLLLQIFTGRGTQHSFTSLMKILWKSSELQDLELESLLIFLSGEQNKSDAKTIIIERLLHNIKYQDDLVS